jgi:hypothetical protein
VSYIYIPSTGAQDWQWLLAKPGLHWKHGASAMALADAWDAADRWPPEVASALDAGGFAGLEPLLAFPEDEVPLPGGRRASQTDLFVLARRPDDPLVTIAIEGKVEELFGERHRRGLAPERKRGVHRGTDPLASWWTTQLDNG